MDFPQKDTIMQTILDPYARLSRSLLGAVQISQCMLFGDWVDF